VNGSARGCVASGTTAVQGRSHSCWLSVIGALFPCILIVPITTLYYDTGFPDRPEGSSPRSSAGLRQLSPDRGIAAVVVGSVEAFSRSMQQFKGGQSCSR